MTVLRVLPWALGVALVGFSIATYPTLPAELPRHADSAGAITSTVPKSWFSWMLLPGIGLLTQAMMFGLSLLLPKRPDLFNFPEKERFLALPPAYRASVIPRMQETLDGISAFTMVVFCYVQWMMWRTALGHSSRDMTIIIIVGSIALLPAILLMTTRVNNAVDEAVKKWKAAGSPAS